MNTKINQQKIIDYYHSIESRLGYLLLLKGIRHFGYYPIGEEKLSIHEAQLRMEEQLSKELNLPRNSHLLDAGCGEGNVAIHLAQNYGYRVTGIDLLDESIKIARRKAKIANLETKINFIQGDYTKVKFPINYFDGIYTMETLVHVEKFRDVLKKFRKILSPAGKLVLFEYTLTPENQLTEHQRLIWQNIRTGTGMYGLAKLYHGIFPILLQEIGFSEIMVEEITPRVIPMLEYFYRLAVVPYTILKILKLEKVMINAMSAVEGYRDLKVNGSWKYIIASARKPKSSLS